MDIDLPLANQTGTLSVERALAARRSIRHFGAGVLSLSHLAQLLWAAQGVTGADERRTTPSAHVLYPLRLLVVVRAVDGVDKGVYGLSREMSQLHLLQRGGEPQKTLQAASLDDQPWVGEASAIIAITADVERMRQHFSAQTPHNRKGERYLYQEVGALAQNVYLQAAALGLGTVLVGGIDERAASKALAVEEPWQVVALMPIGPLPEHGSHH